MVLLNGVWQPADNDGVVIAWIQQGFVGSQTEIRHSSWPHSAMAGSIPNFAGCFFRPPIATAAPVRSQRATPSKGPKIIGAILAALLVMAVASGTTFRVPAIGVLILVLVGTAGTLIILHKVMPAAPMAVRRIGAFVLAWPAVSCAVFVGMLAGAILGFGRRSAPIRECNDLVKAASDAASDKDTFKNGSDPIAIIKEWNVKITDGQSACESVALAKQKADLDESLMILRKHGARAQCLGTSQSALDDIKLINGSHEPEDGLRLLTEFKAKLEKGIAACHQAGVSDLEESLGAMETKQVDPQVENLRLAIAAARPKEVTAGSPTPLPGTSSSLGQCPTMTQYQSIQTGMSRDQVVAVVGPGEQAVEQNIAGMTGEILEWKCTGFFHAGVLLVQFQNGRVVQKSQQGL